jgi:lipoprotein-anchoring transpeptidase ErfK/SrfK
MPRRYELKPTRKRRRGLAPKAKSSRTPRGSSGENSTLPYWIAGALCLVLVILFVIGAEMPRIQSYLAELRSPAVSAEEQAQEKAEAASVQAQQAEDDRRAHLQQQEKLAAEKKRAAAAAALAKAKAAALAQKSPAALSNPNQMTEAQAVAAAQAGKTNPTALTGIPTARQLAPARAMPVDPNILTTERIAAYQVALERRHFSCGFIDGDQGMRTQRMLRAFQQSCNLPMTGVLDPATRAAIGEPGEPFLNYSVTQADIDSIMAKPATWREKAKATRLGYNNIWELLAEKFHCTRGYLRQLNPDVKQPVAGSDIIGPKVYPAAPYPMAASLRVNLGETSIEALDASGRVIAFFPCSIAADKNKRPNGRLVVKSVVPDPDYTFDPALFKDASAQEHITHKMTIPPGPRNPVGIAWIGLSLPGYGIHGTPEPENISRTQSHGCFRLANWNAAKVLRMVRVGTPVDVEP